MATDGAPSLTRFLVVVMIVPSVGFVLFLLASLYDKPPEESLPEPPPSAYTDSPWDILLSPSANDPQIKAVTLPTGPRININLGIDSENPGAIDLEMSATVDVRAAFDLSDLGTLDPPDVVFRVQNEDQVMDAYSCGNELDPETLLETQDDVADGRYILVPIAPSGEDICYVSLTMWSPQAKFLYSRRPGEWGFAASSGLSLEERPDGAGKRAWREGVGGFFYSLGQLKFDGVSREWEIRLDVAPTRAITNEEPIAARSSSSQALWGGGVVHATALIIDPTVRGPREFWKHMFNQGLTLAIGAIVSEALVILAFQLKPRSSSANAKRPHSLGPSNLDPGALGQHSSPPTGQTSASAIGAQVNELDQSQRSDGVGPDE